jgi:hypothetical protein
MCSLDSQSKIWLEDEYIKRYIGELTPLQESKLVQFKKQLSQLQKSKVYYFIYLVLYYLIIVEYDIQNNYLGLFNGLNMEHPKSCLLSFIILKNYHKIWISFMRIFLDLRNFIIFLQFYYFDKFI